MKKKRTFRKFSYRGIELEELLKVDAKRLLELLPARPRRKILRGINHKYLSLIKRVQKARAACITAEDKPEVVKTHLRDMIVLPELIGANIGIYNGNTFNQVEIKPEMVGHYLGEFSLTYKPVKHSQPGVGATHSSRFIPLK